MCAIYIYYFILFDCENFFRIILAIKKNKQQVRNLCLRLTFFVSFSVLPNSHTQHLLCSQAIFNSRRRLISMYIYVHIYTGTQEVELRHASCVTLLTYCPLYIFSYETETESYDRPSYTARFLLYSPRWQILTQKEFSQSPCHHSVMKKTLIELRRQAGCSTELVHQCDTKQVSGQLTEFLLTLLVLLNNLTTLNTLENDLLGEAIFLPTVARATGVVRVRSTNTRVSCFTSLTRKYVSKHQGSSKSVATYSRYV